MTKWPLQTVFVWVFLKQVRFLPQENGSLFKLLYFSSDVSQIVPQYNVCYMYEYISLKPDILIYL